MQVIVPSGKKIYFASDFHLGVPNAESSLAREKRIVAWLDQIKHDAHSLYLLGDIFDFWFEYKNVIPKGFIRVQGKLAELRDAGLPIYFFTGNHDMWMFDYFEKELGIVIYHEPQILCVNNLKIMLGHGDGLNDTSNYIWLKKFFASKTCQWFFARIHPNLGIKIANEWSKRSRIANNKKEQFGGEDKEFLLNYCKEFEKIEHHDFYIFGHRHLPLDLKVGEHSRYINLGEWVCYDTYAVLSGDDIELKKFEG